MIVLTSAMVWTTSVGQYVQDKKRNGVFIWPRVHGTVKLKIWITAQGAVHRVEYLGGHPLLAESALEAVRNWKYAPASQASETSWRSRSDLTDRSQAGTVGYLGRASL